MECVFGVVGRDFAVVVVDTSAVQSILVHKNDEGKIMLLDSHMVLGTSGELGDRVQFTEYVQKNVHLYKFKNNMPLSTAATTNFTHGELAIALRKAPPLPDEPVEIFIGIMSSGNHFAERMGVRKTWMSAVQKSLNVVAHFFVALRGRKEVDVELEKEAEFFGDIVFLCLSWITMI